MKENRTLMELLKIKYLRAQLLSALVSYKYLLKTGKLTNDELNEFFALSQTCDKFSNEFHNYRGE